MKEKEEHIGFEGLISLAGGQAQDPEAEAHVATCDRCHKAYMALCSTGEALGNAFVDAKSTPSCPEDWEVGAYIKKELAPEDASRIAEHIRGCGYCIESAAAYFKALKNGEAELEAPLRWKTNAIGALSGSQKAVEREPSVISTVSASIRRFLSTLPPLPGYALAAAALVFIVISTTARERERALVIASTERVTVRDTEVPSAFGFTGAGETTSVNNMGISFRDDEVVFRWADLEGAKAEEFRLIDRAGRETVLALPGKVHGEASAPRRLLKDGRLYGWLISGKSADGRYFVYTGEFVVAAVKD